MSEVRYSVMFARANTRKHKKWEGDGHLAIHATGEMELTEDRGREIARGSITAKKRAEIEDGYIMNIGGYEIEIQEEVDPETKPVAVITAMPTVTGRGPTPSTLLLATKMPTPDRAAKASASLPKRPLQPIAPSANTVSPPSSEPASKKPALSSTLQLTGARKPFCSPLVTEREQLPPFIVNEEEVEQGAAPVTVDGHIARYLRDHQKEGVTFLYKRLKDRGGGAILADDMGLGKSIQTIATSWALLRRKITRPEDAVRKCLVVVPSSLLNNWRAEFAKWFRSTRTPAILIRKAADIGAYASAHKITPFLVVSYDAALRCGRALAACQFDLLVCDEGHRLKNVNGKLRDILYSMNIPRRLLLTGTPIQNDLDELYSLLDFVRPQAFGTLPEFRAWCKRAGDDSETSSTTADDDVQTTIGDVMLRRTSEVNTKHLPDKHEYVFFCAPSPLQRKIFQAVADHVTGDPLVLIDHMRKASNHPAILYKHLQKGVDDQQKSRVSYASITSVFPRDYGNRPAGIADSGKLSVLTEMLTAFRALKECTVVVSQYTKSLDMIAVLCSSMGMRVLRLDGQTPLQNRQALVDTFNGERNAENVFLLSSKAGGVGLNLIGGSRLILFDLDWNPACDLQAMARIWRDGQPRVCHIYRLVTTGTIDEKILQRQIKKTGLAAVIDVEGLAQNGEKLSFRDEDLADIFSLKTTASNTHDLLECDCAGSGLLPLEREEEEEERRRDEEGMDEDEMLAVVNGEEEYEGDEDRGDNTEKRIDDDEAIGDEEEEGGEEVGELPSGPASMAELFRWRHYGPEDEAAWAHIKAISGVGSMAMEELTFALHYSATF